MDPAVRAELQETGRHLRPARVVHADEEHLWLIDGHEVLRLGECQQPLTGETVREHRHEDRDPRVTEQIERIRDVALDRLHGEDPGELVLQRLGGLSGRDVE